MKVCPAGDSFSYPVGDDVASTSCASPTEITWPSLPLKVLITVDPDYKSSAEEAVNFWAEWLGHNAFVYATGADAVDVEIASGSATSGHLGTTQHTLAGGRLTARVELDSPGDPCQAYRVIGHELGHVLGLAHDAPSSSIMSGYLDFGLDGEEDCYDFLYVVTDNDKNAINGKYFP